MPTPTIQIGLRVPAPLYEQIKLAASKDDRTINGYMVTLLKRHVPANGKKA